jgi:hypothetical protein
MASVHKDQALPRPKRPRGAEEAGERHAAAPPAVARPAAVAQRTQLFPPLALKIFVGLLGLGLLVSALLGVVVALSTRSTRLTASAMLIGGTLLPLALLLA